MKRNQETPRYIIRAKCINFQTKSIEWNFLGEGRKNTNLQREVNHMNHSILYGANKHIAHLQSLYSDAVLIDQRNMNEVSSYKAPMFSVLPAKSDFSIPQIK